MKKFLFMVCSVLMATTMLAFSGCATGKSKPGTNIINFMVEGEVWQSLELGEITELPVPNKQYCDFAGWYLDDNKIELNDLSGGGSLYAKFTLNSRYECLEVLSDSMQPTMYKGDYIIIDTEAAEFEVEDIIVFKLSELAKPVAHRIIAIDGVNYITKGDANASPNAETVTASQIIGLVCENIGTTIPDDIIVE